MIVLVSEQSSTSAASWLGLTYLVARLYVQATNVGSPCVSKVLSTHLGEIFRCLYGGQAPQTPRVSLRSYCVYRGFWLLSMASSAARLGGFGGLAPHKDNRRLPMKDELKDFSGFPRPTSCRWLQTVADGADRSVTGGQAPNAEAKGRAAEKWRGRNFATARRASG